MTELDGMTWEQWEEIQRRSPVKTIETVDLEAYLQYLWDRGEYDE